MFNCYKDKLYKIRYKEKCLNILRLLKDNSITSKGKVVSKQPAVIVSDKPEKVEETPVRAVAPVSVDVREGVMHCCYTLSPKAFDTLRGRKARLPFATWYKAVWLVQHNANMNISELQKELGVSWQTAKEMRTKILHILEQ